VYLPYATVVVLISDLKLRLPLNSLKANVSIARRYERLEESVSMAGSGGSCADGADDGPLRRRSSSCLQRSQELRTARPCVLEAVRTAGLIADLVADHTADGSATHGSQCAAIGKHRSRDAADTCADRGVSLTFGHAGAGGEHENGGNYSRLNDKATRFFHDVTLSE
jgi:hypothetical protein